MSTYGLDLHGPLLVGFSVGNWLPPVLSHPFRKVEGRVGSLFNWEVTCRDSSQDVPRNLPRSSYLGVNRYLHWLYYYIETRPKERKGQSKRGQGIDDDPRRVLFDGRTLRSRVQDERSPSDRIYRPFRLLTRRSDEERDEKGPSVHIIDTDSDSKGYKVRDTFRELNVVKHRRRVSGYVISDDNEGKTFLCFRVSSVRWISFDVSLSVPNSSRD